MSKNSAMKAIQWTIFVMMALFMLGWWLTTSGLFDSTSYFTIISGLGMGILLLINSHIVTYVKQSGYRTITAADGLVIAQALIGGAIITLSIIQIPILGIGLPIKFVDFLFYFNIGAGLIGLLINIPAMIFLIKRGA